MFELVWTTQVTGNYENQLKGGEFYGKNTLAFELEEEGEGEEDCNREEHDHHLHNNNNNNHKSPSKDIFNINNYSNNSNKNQHLEPFFNSLSIDSNPDISTIQPLKHDNNTNINKHSQANVSALRDLLEKEIGTFHFSKIHKSA